MIVSIHVPKTAGKSFRLRLEAAYAPRLLSDYGDWIGLDNEEARRQQAASAAQARARRDEIARDYDLIYGQFVADKYLGLFADAAFTAFLREPCQRAVSHYQFLLRHPELGQHPWIRQFLDTKPPLPELIRAVPSYQAMFLGSLAVEDLAVVGLTEQYERSVALFEAVFGRKLPAEAARGNVNPNRAEPTYPIDPEVRAAIDTYHAADVELYRCACERFERLALHYGV